MIPAIVVPLSIIATYGGMALLGFSINNVSLLALTLCVGFVVDDAIVMMENIVRYIERGMTPFEAALKGSKEIGFTILSITLSLVAVFIPVLFMGGIIGRLFREFAVTISFAVLASGLISLTLTPMLCSRWLKPHTGEHEESGFGKWLERGFNAMLGLYEKTLAVRSAASPPHPVRHLSHAGRIDGRIHETCPRDFFRWRIPVSFSPFTEAAQDVSYEAMVENSARRRRSSRPIPRWKTSFSPSAAGAAHSIPGAFSSVSRRKASGLRPWRSSSGCAASSAK